MRICKTCKIEKEEIEFSFDFKENFRQIHCKECMRIKNRERMRKERANNEFRLKERKNDFNRRMRNPEKEMFNRAEKRAQVKGIAFDIEVKDIFIPEICPLLGIKIFPQKGGAGDCSPSLDRVDTTKGYVKGNVRVISRLANIMKAHATKEQLFLFIQNLPNYLALDKSCELLESPEEDNQQPSITEM
jgi:hypothetical protein